MCKSRRGHRRFSHVASRVSSEESEGDAFSLCESCSRGAASTCRVFVTGRSYLQTVLQVTIYNYSSAIRSDRAVSIFLAVCRATNVNNAASVLGVSPDEGNVYVHPCPARHDAPRWDTRNGTGMAWKVSEQAQLFFYLTVNFAVAEHSSK